VVTRLSADQEFAGGSLRRRRRDPLTRGLNRNHNPLLKAVFKGAADAAAATAFPLKDYYDACVGRDSSEEQVIEDPRRVQGEDLSASGTVTRPMQRWMPQVC